MTSRKITRFVSCLIVASLFVSGSFGFLTLQKASAKTNDGTGRRSDKVAPNLRKKVRRSSSQSDTVKVILQINGTASLQLLTFLRSNGVQVRKSFANFNSHMVELPLAAVDQLAAFPEVQTVSIDDEVKPFGHVSLTTGADAARANNGLLNPGVDGTGIGIAVLDSGFDVEHIDF